MEFAIKRGFITIFPPILKYLAPILHFLPLMALKVFHTSVAEVFLFILETKSLQVFLFASLTILLASACAFLYVINNSCVGLDLYWRKALFLFVSATRHSDVHHGTFTLPRMYDDFLGIFKSAALIISFLIFSQFNSAFVSVKLRLAFF